MITKERQLRKDTVLSEDSDKYAYIYTATWTIILWSVGKGIPFSWWFVDVVKLCSLENFPSKAICGIF